MQILNADPDILISTPSRQVLSAFLEEFRRMVEPMTPLLRTTIAFASGRNSFLISKDRGCSCLHPTDEQMIQESEACTYYRAIHLIEITYQDNSIGTLSICYDRSKTSAPEIVQHLVETSIRIVALEKEEENLLEELGASWESLGAVYEITSDLRSIQNHTEALDRIMDKAISLEEGLQAALWIEQAGFLETTITRNTNLKASRNSSSGLLARAILQGRGLVINGRSRISAFDLTEPELSHAQRVIIAPIATKRSVIGALEIWQEYGEKDFDSRTMRLIEALALQLAMVIENERLYREYIQSDRLRQEIDIGSKIQQTLLLGNPPCNVSGISLASLTIPSQNIDGDFYDFIRHSDHCLDIVIGDVMGKGVPAALFGAATKSQFIRAAGHTISSSGNIRLPIPEEIVNLVHTDVVSQFMEFDSFVTVCYARFDTKLRRMDYVDCGHTRTVHFQRDKNSYRLLEGDNIPIGFARLEVYNQVSVEFSEGDIFLFYSDGITETKSRNDEMFGEERLAQLLCSSSRLSSSQILRKIQKELSAFSESETFADDLTCLVVKIPLKETQTQSSSEPSSRLVIQSDLKELERVREFARQVCTDLAPPEVSEDLIFQIKLALTEAVTNIIRHAYKERSGETIQIEAYAQDDSLVIQLSHNGESFDPTKVPPPAFDGSRDGGFGLFIIASIIGKVEYSCDEQGRNVITLIKKFQEEN